MGRIENSNALVALRAYYSGNLTTKIENYGRNYVEFLFDRVWKKDAEEFTSALSFASGEYMSTSGINLKRELAFILFHVSSRDVS